MQNNLKAPTQNDSKLTENVDYYLEDGRLVFTAAYLQKRGYCCESGCRHCPYGFKKAKG